MKRRKFLKLFSLAPLAFLVPKVFAKKVEPMPTSLMGAPIKYVDEIDIESNPEPYVNLVNSSGDGGYFVPQSFASNLKVNFDRDRGSAIINLPSHEAEALRNIITEING